MLLFLLACGSPTPTAIPQPTPLPTDCAIGSEDCVCTEGGSCDGDLECVEGICVMPACPVGSLDCPCTDGGTCDGDLVCLSTDLCGPEPECGNDVVEDGETCDDGNTVTEACAYGETGCTVCDASCQETAGATSFCGDGSVEPAEEACDDPSADPDCAYGQTSCTVCTTSCTETAGNTAYCGNSVLDTPWETCDGDAYCGSDCEPLGESYEPNDGISDAVVLYPSATDSTFSHPSDVVHGPGLSPSFIWESPDYFVVEALCPGGTITYTVDYQPTDGRLELAVGRRPQMGTPSGPPPVYFEWFDETPGVSQLSVTVTAELGLERDHYAKVAVHDSESYAFVPYTISGSTSCPPN